MLIDVIAGARPNFIKIAPIIAEIERAKNNGADISYRLIHTGQHYDEKMSGNFFEELNIPKPHFNLEVGSGTHAEQTGKIMFLYEAILLKAPCDLCLVVGDVTSTMACAITAKKVGNIKIAHVEAGIRSGDRSMPEEVNRIVTDAITDYFFTTSHIANANLLKAGVNKDAIFFVGNTMIDTLLKNIPRLSEPKIWNDVNLKREEYVVMTLHRPNNVDNPSKLAELINAIVASAKSMKVIFPVHPRTAKVLEDIDINTTNLFTTAPLGYLEFNFLVKNAKAIITDSGGITEEATVMGIPCMTLRNSTERPETCSIGTNELLGTSIENISRSFEKLYSNNWKKGSIPELWDGKAANRIVATILALNNSFDDSK